jgi:hypothetical protein
LAALTAFAAERPQFVRFHNKGGGEIGWSVVAHIESYNKQGSARRSAGSQRWSDLEFSEYGRDPRFAAGWWLVPASLTAMVLAVWLLG